MSVVQGQQKFTYTEQYTGSVSGWQTAFICTVIQRSQLFSSRASTLSQDLLFSLSSQGKGGENLEKLQQPLQIWSHNCNIYFPSKKTHFHSSSRYQKTGEFGSETGQCFPVMMLHYRVYFMVLTEEPVVSLFHHPQSLFFPLSNTTKSFFMAFG